MSEHQHQVAYFQWVEMMAQKDERYANIFAIPNGGQRHVAVGRKMKREGQKKGVPDIFIAWPQGSQPGKFLELKVGKGKMSPHQIEWFQKLKAYNPEVCYGVDELIRRTEEYFSN